MNPIEGIKLAMPVFSDSAFVCGILLMCMESSGR
jgi:hypothetical protein